jgi:hypothetical protein
MGGAADMAGVVEHLPSMYKPLGSLTSTTKKKKKKEYPDISKC